MIADTAPESQRMSPPPFGDRVRLEHAPRPKKRTGLLVTITAIALAAAGTAAVTGTVKIALPWAAQQPSATGSAVAAPADAAHRATGSGGSAAAHITSPSETGDRVYVSQIRAQLPAESAGSSDAVVLSAGHGLCVLLRRDNPDVGAFMHRLVHMSADDKMLITSTFWAADDLCPDQKAFVASMGANLG